MWITSTKIGISKDYDATKRKTVEITGNVVNVAADVTTSISLLPLLPTQTATFKVNLKRKLQ